MRSHVERKPVNYHGNDSPGAGSPCQPWRASLASRGGSCTWYHAGLTATGITVRHSG